MDFASPVARAGALAQDRGFHGRGKKLGGDFPVADDGVCLPNLHPRPRMETDVRSRQIDVDSGAVPEITESASDGPEIFVAAPSFEEGRACFSE